MLPRREDEYPQPEAPTSMRGTVVQWRDGMNARRVAGGVTQLA